MPREIIDPLNGAFRVLREIQAPQQVQPAPDLPSGWRVSSAAFKPTKDGSVSVDLEESLQAAGLGIESRFPAMPRAVAAVAHRVDTVRSHQLSVHHDPIFDDPALPDNPHHGEIRPGPERLSRRQRDEVARTLADSCELVVPFDLEAIKTHLP